MATLPRPAQSAPSPLLEVIEPLLSVPQAAKILGISQCTLRNWIQRKKIARVKVGGRIIKRGLNRRARKRVLKSMKNPS